MVKTSTLKHARTIAFFCLALVLAAPSLPEEPEYAEIHIFRPKQFQGGAVIFQVLANTQKLVHLSNGSRSILRVFKQGAIDFKLKASVFTSKTVSLGVVRGEKYYIKAGYDDGFGSKLSFVPLTATQGKEAFNDRSQFYRPKIKIIEDKENRFRALSEDDIYSVSIEEIENKDGAKPRLGWISPQRNFQRTEVGIFSLQLCLISEAESLNIKVLHNGDVFEELQDIPVADKKCSYTYISNLSLTPGSNKLEIYLTDEFGESKFSRSLTYKPQEKTSKRGLALIIGNSNYEHASDLSNPDNDAADMEKALVKLNFEVMKFSNLGNEEMKKAIGNYLLKLEEYSTGVVFYAGHGIQHGGRNYLIPVDVNLADELEITKKCFDTGSIITRMNLMEVETSVIMLDACRSDPFKGLDTRITDSTTGLTGTDAPPGTIVAFATAPGKTASDGTGRNGLYTQEILKHIYKPELKVEDLFKQVRVSVMNKSRNQQIPWETSSLVKDFYFYEQPN
ncbi:MAG: caspase family protein [Bacteroidota bacterium]